MENASRGKASDSYMGVVHGRGVGYLVRPAVAVEMDCDARGSLAGLVLAENGLLMTARCEVKVLAMRTPEEKTSTRVVSSCKNEVMSLPSGPDTAPAGQIPSGG
jgi:hypothetical protein